jgi:hypothetical protein
MTYSGSSESIDRHCMYVTVRYVVQDSMSRNPPRRTLLPVADFPMRIFRFILTFDDDQ